MKFFFVTFNHPPIAMHPGILLLPLIFLLSACSPHPGAGGWGATSADALFERLEIRYNGQAHFYARKQDDNAVWRCFWSTAGGNQLNLKCVEAENANNEQNYVFLVEDGKKQGSLLQGGQNLGQYAWQPPTEPTAE